MNMWKYMDPSCVCPPLTTLSGVPGAGGINNQRYPPHWFCFPPRGEISATNPPICQQDSMDKILLSPLGLSLQKFHESGMFEWSGSKNFNKLITSLRLNFLLQQFYKFSIFLKQIAYRVRVMKSYEYWVLFLELGTMFIITILYIAILCANDSTRKGVLL
jgi:hypothetical protein